MHKPFKSIHIFQIYIFRLFAWNLEGFFAFFFTRVFFVLFVSSSHLAPLFSSMLFRTFVTHLVSHMTQACPLFQCFGLLMFGSLSFQLKELAENLVTNFEGANYGHLLQVRPRQSGNDRRLVEVLVHFLVIMRCLPPNPLLQPLVALAFDPASMTVRIFCNMY